MGGCLGKEATAPGGAGAKYLANGEHNRASQQAAGAESDCSSRATEIAEEAQIAVAHATGAIDYSSWVEVAVSCANVKATPPMQNALVASRSDVMAALFENKKGVWEQTARTEVKDNGSPEFVKKFRLLYNFEEVQTYRIAIVDVDKRHDPEHVDVALCAKLGEVEFKLSELVTATDRCLKLDLEKSSRKATVTLIAEELSSSRDVITMQIAASDLKPRRTMSGFPGRGMLQAQQSADTNPFLEICACDEAGRWKPVFKTEVVKGDLNPVWNNFSIKATQLNNGDTFRPLRLRVYDYDAGSKHRLMGEASTNAMRLVEMAGTANTLPLHDPDTQVAGGCGSLRVVSQSVTQKATFLDFIQAGTELRFMIGVDYTASNKDPRDRESLHYLNPAGGRTPYEEAIVGVAQVLQAYDRTKVYDCYGFGSKVPGGIVQHCTPLGADGTGACDGLEGVLRAYRQALFSRALSGPTLFAPLLRQASAAAQEQAQGGKCYTVLLILTDGLIHDMQDSIDTLVSASNLPLSIIIVGVGNSPELEQMKVLDSDGKVMVDRHGSKATRDIVQYVKFSDFENDGVALASELLAELPGQLLEYMRVNNIVPSGASPMGMHSTPSPDPLPMLPSGLTVQASALSAPPRPL